MSNFSNRFASITAELITAIERRDESEVRVMDRELMDCLRECLWTEEQIRFELNRREMSKDHVGHQDRRA